MKITEEIKYQYKNAPIPGGGYVTGLVYHKKKSGILYARTDIGGTYRFNESDKKWESLINYVTGENLAETYPIALALDDNYPERLYIISGVREDGYGVLSISEDYGKSFTYKKVPAVVHGNLSGRGTGYRLVVDKNNSDTMYFASQLGGLFKSTDRGDTWKRLDIEENYMTFVWVSDDSNIIVVGTAGYTTRHSDDLRGHSLYVSYDKGKSFEKLMQPDNYIVSDSKMNGLVASRYDYDGKYLYVTMNSTGRWNYIVDLGYSCDTGDVIGGRVIRYYFEDGKIAGYDDITPDEEGVHTEKYLNYGFGGICSCESKPGLLVCSSLCKEKENFESIYVSKDYGDTWQVSLAGLSNIKFRTSYMEPKYNGDVSIIHWCSDIKINPFNPNEVWFNSGTGVFKTDNLLGEKPLYFDYSDGIEETVHLNTYGPVKGDVKLVAILGDLGGFAFTDLNKTPDNSFDDRDGNRYITCINCDISDKNGNLSVIMARGNWKGKTKGGLVKTTDGFKTFERVDMPFYLEGKIADKLRRIENPNVNPGWVAMSPDGKNIVWSVADDIRLPADMVITTNDGGKNFVKSKIYDICGTEVKEGYFKTFSDRKNEKIFYGFGSEGQMYVSDDGGISFNEKSVRAFDKTGNEIDVPKYDFGYIDTANKTEIRGVAGSEGVMYIAMSEEGLWKFTYNKDENFIKLIRLTDKGENCYRVGLGVGRTGGDYVSESKAIYICGVIDNKYGFYRTLDECKTYVKINSVNQMYGQINSMDGDKKEFGRFFIGTGSRGVLYGEEVK